MPMTSRDFYVYVIFRPDGRPCYVGKGKGDRWLHHERRAKAHYNKHLSHIIAAAVAPLPKIKVREDLTEAEASAIEIAFIAAIGRADLGLGPLVNLTDGGDGKTGWVPSIITRKKIASSNTGKKQSALTKARMSAAGTGKTKSLDHRQAIGAAHMGMKRSDEAKAKMRAAKLRIRDQISQRVTAYHATMNAAERKARGDAIRKGMSQQ